MPKIASRDVKFETESRAYKLTKSKIAEDLDEATIQKLSDTALASYRAVKLRDYGRIDMRLTPEGEVFVIEANPNPWLSSKHEFAMAAKKSGRSYTQLIGEIVEMALERTRVTNSGS
jgi:D-alanine-D-alanine ligase